MNMHSTIKPAADRSAWDAAMARYMAAQAASDEYDERVYRPVYDEIYRRAPRPDLTLKVPLADGSTYTEQLIPAFLNSDCERGRFGGAVVPFRDAWRAHEKTLAQVEQELGFAATAARHEALVEDFSDAHTSLLLIPAPDLAALRWKLGETIEPGTGGDINPWCDEIRLAIVADYERLLPNALPIEAPQI